jgi:hypothetical protein
VQLAFTRQLQQLIVRDRVPEEERELGRQFEIADRIHLAGMQVGRNVLAAIEEERAREHPGQRASNAGFEAAVLHAVLVVLH